MIVYDSEAPQDLVNEEELPSFDMHRGESSGEAKQKYCTYNI